MTALSRARPGVTMIELIIVTAILVGLAGVVLVVIDAPGRLEGAVVSQEKVNAEAVTKALQLSMVDNFGLIESVKPLTPGEERDICKPGVFDENCVNLDKLVEDGYLAQIPVQKEFLDDPEATITGYKVVRETAYLAVRSRNTEGVGTSGGGGNGGGGSGGNNDGGTGDDGGETGEDDGGGGGTQDYQLTAWNNYSTLTNDYVTDTLTVNGVTYVAGKFASMFVQTGRVTAISKATGLPVPATFVGKPTVNANSTMNAGDIVPDGNGGWFFAGNFSSITPLMGTADTSYDEIIHVLPDGSIDSWKPVFDAESTFANVQSIEYNPTRQILIAVGNFNTELGEPLHFMAFDMSQGGAVIPWHPQVDAPINDVKIIGDTLFIGGTFTTVNGGTPRASVAAFDIGGEVPTLLPWNPSPTGSVTVFEHDGDTLYAGGVFGQMNDGVNGGGSPAVRVGIAAFDISDPENIGLSSWAPSLSVGFNGIRAIRADATRVYLGGQFTSVGGQARTHLAAVDKSTGAVDPWNPVLSTSPALGQTMVRSLVLDDGILYAGGNFQIDGTNHYAAAFDMNAGGSVTSWDPGFGNEVMALNTDDNNVYAVGKFTTVRKFRSNLLSINANGVITDWNPGVTGAGTPLVTTLKTDGTRLFIGGNFTGVAGQSRENLASFDLSTGELNEWNPGANAQTAIDVHGGNVYVTGDFTTVGGQSGLGKLVRINAASGEVDTSFHPEPNTKIQAIAFAGSYIYVGGDFSTIDGQARSGLATLDQNGNVLAWDPSANGAVRALSVNGSTLYAGGTFTSIDGESRSGAAAFDVDDGTLTSWAPSVPFPVRVIKRNGSIVYIGGDQSGSNPYLIATDAGDGSTLGWNSALSTVPLTGTAIGDIEFSGNKMYVNGYFITDYSQQGNPLIFSLVQYGDQ